MSHTRQILSATTHRPYNYPTGRWMYYQEWNGALFLHWKVDEKLLRPLVPEKFVMDCFEGDHYVSLVAFTMQKIRPRFLPALKFVSDFHEVNIRTYVKYNNRGGVYFLNIQAAKPLSVFIAKMLSALPYKLSEIRRNAGNYRSANEDFQFNADFDLGAPMQKTPLDKWLTERYCLYLKRGAAYYRYEIHHKEWEIQQLHLNRMSLLYNRGDLSLTGATPDLTHYSPGVKVVAWQKTPL